MTNDNDWLQQWSFIGQIFQSSVNHGPQIVNDVLCFLLVWLEVMTRLLLCGKVGVKENGFRRIQGKRISSWIFFSVRWILFRQISFYLVRLYQTLINIEKIVNFHSKANFHTYCQTKRNNTYCFVPPPPKKPFCRNLCVCLSSLAVMPSSQSHFLVLTAVYTSIMRAELWCMKPETLNDGDPMPCPKVIVSYIAHRSGSSFFGMLWL